MSKKLLIISVSVGGGHVSAGNALLKYAQKPEYNIEAQHIDMLQYVNLPVRKTFIKTYDLVLRQAPSIWNYIYNKSNNPTESSAIRDLTKMINRINSTELYKYIGKFSPDMIVATHFLPAQAILGAPKRYKTDATVSLVMTDYDKHSLLITPGMKRYFVASEKIKWKLRNQNIEVDNIVQSGIPVDPIFYEKIDLTELQDKHKLGAKRKVLTVMSGGQGSAKTNYVAEALFKTKEPITIFAIAGNNKKLERKLRSLTTPSHVDLRVIGWTDKVHEYLRVSDMVITKPGGLSTTECAVLQKPIIAVDPIPGQEVQNTYHILENNFGVAASSSEDLLYYVSQKPETLSPGYLRQNKSQPTTQAGDIIMQSLLNI